MRTNIFSSALIISLLTISHSAMSQQLNSPNIVLIMADDLGFECISANGSEDYKTPVIDGLAESGVRFEQGFANPLCTPSRVKIMTGLYNKRNYVSFGVLHRSQKTFAHQLKQVLRNLFKQNKLSS